MVLFWDQYKQMYPYYLFTFVNIACGTILLYSYYLHIKSNGEKKFQMVFKCRLHTSHLTLNLLLMSKKKQKNPETNNAMVFS